MNVQQIREGGHVQRCHVVPHVGSYSVAEHSWQAAVLYLCLCPDPNPVVTQAILLHDTQERWVGDAPAPAKWDFVALGRQYMIAESQARRALCLPQYDFTEEDHWWCKGVDVLELYLWCRDQEAFGNQHITELRNNIAQWFNKNREFLPALLWNYWNEYDWKRTSDHLF